MFHPRSSADQMSPLNQAELQLNELRKDFFGMAETYNRLGVVTDELKQMLKHFVEKVMRLQLIVDSLPPSPQRKNITSRLQALLKRSDELEVMLPFLYYLEQKLRRMTCLPTSPESCDPWIRSIMDILKDNDVQSYDRLMLFLQDPASRASLSYIALHALEKGIQ